MRGMDELMVGPEDVVGKADEVAKEDPMGMSQTMSLHELVEVQNKHIDHLEQVKKDLSGSLVTKVTEVDQAKKELAEQQKKAAEELARELRLVAEQSNALVVAKAEKEQLEKELGVRRKSEEERRVAREKTIGDRMFEAILLARTVVLREWENEDEDEDEDEDGCTRSLAHDSAVHDETEVVDGYEKLLTQFALKLYDELKAAEEAEKEKPPEKTARTSEELRALAWKAAGIAIKSGQYEGVSGALAGVVLRELLK